MEDQRKRRAWNTSYLAYNDLSPDHNGYHDSIIVSELNRFPRAAFDRNLGPIFSPLGPNIWIDPFGYVAPPLYGVWGNAPFFHNGSVPDVWGVLKPSTRSKVWKRQYTAASRYGKNRGYDVSFSAFDFDKLGWKHEALDCSDAFWKNPFLPCSEYMSTIDIIFANIANSVAEHNSLGYQSPPPITDKQIKSRMIFNSHLYGQGNQGHEFTQSLADDERWAIIEYLKTL
jgi:exo-cleaving rubber dioxygenase